MNLFGVKLRRVVGHSMEPTLPAGQLCVFKKKLHTINSIVLAEHEGKEIVKRVVRIEQGTAWLEGDNKNSHHNEIVAKQAVQGVLVWPRVR